MENGHTGNISAQGGVSVSKPLQARQLLQHGKYHQEVHFHHKVEKECSELLRFSEMVADFILQQLLVIPVSCSPHFSSMSSDDASSFSIGLYTLFTLLSQRRPRRPLQENRLTTCNMNWE